MNTVDYRFVLIKGPMPTLNDKIDHIDNAFRQQNIETYVFDVRNASDCFSDLIRFVMKSQSIVLTFNNVGVNLTYNNCNFWTHFGIPFYTWLVDHPRNYYDILLNPPCELNVLVVDDDHKKFIDYFFPKVQGTYKLLNGGRLSLPINSSEMITLEEFNEYSNREYEVVYMSTNGQPTEFFPKIEYYDDGGRGFFQSTVFALLHNPNHTTEEVIEDYFSRNSIPVSEEELFENYVNYSSYIENYVRREIRFTGIKLLDDAGVKVDIWGNPDSWISNRYPFTNNVTIHDRIPAEDVPDILRHSKLVLCYTPWFKNGCSEKQFDAFAAGALCVSDHNSYIDENYTDNEELVLFDLSDQIDMANRVRYMLDNPYEAFTIARRGQMKALERELWGHRVKELLAIVEEDITEGHKKSDYIKIETESDDNSNTDYKSYQKHISIIIPCYNCSDTIVRAWTSLKKQTIGIDKLECIFVDDASTDDGQTWDKLKKIEAECPESVMIIHLDENLRQGGARNVGISYASGKYLMFLDADDELVSNSCEILYNKAENESADIIQFNHRRVLGNQSRDSIISRENKLYQIENSSDRAPFLNSTIVDYGCWNKFYKLDLVKKADARFAEHAVYEEPLFVYPCFLYAERVVFVTDILYLNNLHMDSTVGSKIGVRLLDHPRVQLELLEYCMNHQDIYVENKDSIELYFLWSYYCETLCFAGEQEGSLLPLEYFHGMQEICKMFFSNWRSNPFITRLSGGVLRVLDSINMSINSDEELSNLINRTTIIMNGGDAYD